MAGGIVKASGKTGIKNVDEVSEVIEKTVKKSLNGKTAESVAEGVEETVESVAKHSDEITDATGNIAKHNNTTVNEIPKTTVTFFHNIEFKNGKYYSDKKTIDEIGKIEAKSEDFSKLNKRIMSSRTSTEGGTSTVYRYSDEMGTKYIIHEVTDANGYIIHRDFDAVRISSGQLINKGD